MEFFMTGPGDLGELERLAAALLDGEDDRLLAEIARLYELVDPMPADLVERIGFTLTLADMEIELARLIVESRTPVGARGGEEHARTVTFSSDSLTVMVTITPTADAECRIDGWIAPGAAIRVELRSNRGSCDVIADVDGRFDFADVPCGLVQLVFHPTPDVDVQLRSPVVTPAVQV
jgi:hypothetical protein